MKEMVTLKGKEQKRLAVSNQVKMGKMISREAVEVSAYSANGER